jgi:phage terminase large subunit-like protein
MSRKKTHSMPSTTTATASPTNVEKIIQHGRDATRYAEMIRSGEIDACMWVRLACERHLYDIERSKSADYPFRFDERKAGRVCYFIELLPHVDGNWGSPTIQLELWQKFVLGSIFGWVKKADGLRRFKKAYISVPRKNAKTTKMAGVGFYCLTKDGERGAQVYNGANKLEQAEMLFLPAKLMMDRRPELFQKLGITKRGEKAIWHLLSGSRWRPISKTPGDGGGAHLFIQDEFHEAKTDKMTSTIEDGQGARKQGLSIKITTAGDNIGGPCYNYELQIQKILEQSISRETTFGIIYTIDSKKYVDPFGIEREADDWTTVEAAKKANPNWGVSVLEEPFLADLEEATQDLSKQATFKTKRLNIWCNALNGFYDVQKWNALADSSLKIEDFAGENCVEGLDLASKLDLCATAPVFRRELPGIDPETGEPCMLDHYYVFCKSYLPSSVANKPENTDYRAWADQGWLKITQGNITDYGFILRDLLKTAESHNLCEVDFDQREAGFLLQEFEKVHGDVPLFEVAQNTPTLSEPMKWLQSLIVDGRIHHDGNPLLAWAISNVVAKRDANENVFPRKAKDELKIDPHSALLNAMVRVRDVLTQPQQEDDTETQVW